jgi:adenine-specific DNA-methyltransferase
MILFYTKSDEFKWAQPREPMSAEDIQRLFPKVDTSGRRYTTTPLHAPGETEKGDTGKPWKGIAPPHGRHWRVSREELTRLDKAGLIEWSSTGNPRKKLFADDAVQRGKLLQDVWELKDPPYPTYPTEKNLAVVHRIIEATSEVGDIVLDCFVGSGTTLVAAESLQRAWIGIDSSAAAIRVTKSRLNAFGTMVNYCELRAK